MKFKGNFGELTLIINGTEAAGTYQENGTLKGLFVNNTFKGHWKNKGMEGLVEFTITDNKLLGNWKKGLEAGPMKGKWEGELISTILDDIDQKSLEQNDTGELDPLFNNVLELTSQIGEVTVDILREVFLIGTNRAQRLLEQIEKNKDCVTNTKISNWNIIHDIFTFYTFFANLAQDGSQDLENEFCVSEIKKWQFEIDGIKYGLAHGNPESFIALADKVFDELYVEGDSVTKDPFIRLNRSHSNLADYFNEGNMNCKIIKTLWNSLVKLCQLRGINQLQSQQLIWHIDQWSSVCPEMKKFIE